MELETWGNPMSSSCQRGDVAVWDSSNFFGQVIVDWFLSLCQSSSLPCSCLSSDAAPMTQVQIKVLYFTALYFLSYLALSRWLLFCKLRLLVPSSLFLFFPSLHLKVFTRPAERVSLFPHLGWYPLLKCTVKEKIFYTYSYINVIYIYSFVSVISLQKRKPPTESWSSLAENLI